ncbi:hypothetical protein [Rhodohalobacter sp. 614A]|uniref:hypothetical protein n=1 Tax=Rhodohalobacter sp. 614A TaxID=2908649 RepID=UPI001F32119D|nr:hypothetical protein [Rhodohalobacter sp. 614A]
MRNTNFLKTVFLSGLLFVAASFIHTVQAQHAPGKTELGVVLGEPTGVSLQLWQSGTTAIDGALAWSFGKHDKIHIHADYLIHNPLEVDRGSLTFYYGIGARAILTDEARFGARIPVGLQYIIPDSRISLFFEVAPIFDLIPATDFDVNGGIGVRYFL